MNEWSRGLQPFKPEDYYNRGLAKFRLGSYRFAIDDFTQSLSEFEGYKSKDPADRMRIQYMRALCHRRLGSSYWWVSEYRAAYRSLSKKAQVALENDEDPGPWAIVIDVNQ